MFYNLDGIVTAEPVGDNFFVIFNGYDFSLKEGDITPEIDFACVELHNLFSKKLFGSLKDYYNLLPAVPYLLTTAGIDPEVKIAKEDFEKIVLANEQDETFNKVLYNFDCRNLVSTLQNSVSETKYLFGQFYEILNTRSFLLNEIVLENDGLQFASGYLVANIYSVINSIFINLYSQLDFITKVIYELENVVQDFKKYPKLKSEKMLYGDAKRTKLNGIPNTLFEPNNTVQTIITIRNEVVHNASLENNPRVYHWIKDKKVIEKFILLPDFKDGRLVTFRSRKRFFDYDIKLNQVLPSLVIDFWKRLYETIHVIGKTL